MKCTYCHNEMVEGHVDVSTTGMDIAEARVDFIPEGEQGEHARPKPYTNIEEPAVNRAWYCPRCKKILVEFEKIE